MYPKMNVQQETASVVTAHLSCTATHSDTCTSDSMADVLLPTAEAVRDSHLMHLLQQMAGGSREWYRLSAYQKNLPIIHFEGSCPVYYFPLEFGFIWCVRHEFCKQSTLCKDVHPGWVLEAYECDVQVETIYLGDRRIQIRTSVLEDKCTACNMLCCYADELKHGFLPWVQQVAPLSQCSIVLPTGLTHHLVPVQYKSFGL